MKSVPVKQTIFSFILLGFTLLSFQAHAASIISYSGYSYEDTNNYVTGGDLEWLRWDQAAGITSSEVSSQGWRFATANDVASLFNDFKLGDYTLWSDTDTSWQSKKAPNAVGSENSPEEYFTSIFGSTYDYTYYATNGEGELNTSQVYFYVENSGYKFADVSGDYMYAPCDHVALDLCYVAASARMSATYYTQLQLPNGKGLAYVRDLSPALVPVPPSFILMLTGLLGLGALHRKHMKTNLT